MDETGHGGGGASAIVERNVSKVFEELPIAQVRAHHASTAKDVDVKKQELRMLVA